MTLQTQEFLAFLGGGQPRQSGTLAADLRRLKIGSHALLAELRRRARAGEEMVAWHTAAWQLARMSQDDRVLDAAIADAQDRI